jgi:O-antigen/teichoic acid export membrane protein
VLPEVTAEHYSFNGKLLREMLSYSFPLLIIGIAGIMNQTLDKILYPMLIPDRHEALTGLGIYGANYKIAIVMVMFIQAFRFAYEPFIFAQNREKGEDKTKAYSTAMNWFVICGLFIFLGVMFYLPIIKYFISPDYFDGLRVVPIVMLAELFFGIFFNLSVWYKITDRTIWGTWFSLLGLIITLAINIIFVPKYGFIACAWAAFSCYGIMMIASYAVGRWKHPIEYNIARLFTYFVVAIGLWGLSTVITTDTDVIDFAVRLLLLGVYALFVYLVEVRRPAASAKKQ